MRGRLVKNLDRLTVEIKILSLLRKTLRRPGIAGKRRHFSRGRAHPQQDLLSPENRRRATVSHQLVDIAAIVGGHRKNGVPGFG